MTNKSLNSPFLKWIFCLLSCIWIFKPIPGFALTELKDIAVSNSQDSARVTFSLTERIPYEVFMLINPNRLIVDFSNTQSKFNPSRLKIANVKTIRTGHPKPTTLRIVFDLSNGVRFKYSFQKQRNQLQIDIYSTREFEKPIATIAQPIVKLEKIVSSKPFVVVIDPGHGGKDSGAVGENRTQEKNVVLAISKRLAELINATSGMRAVLTRNGDYFVPLRDRLRLARKDKGDVFIAIHADSYFNNRASGASIYALSRRGATTEAARWLAKRENYSELGGVDLGELGDQSYLLRSVLIDLAQTATTTDSLRLGNLMLASLDDITKLHYAKVEQAPFVVLKSPDIPSVLVETGFISNNKEEMRLQDKNYQRKLAQALFNGLQQYIKQYSANF